jgi:triacylglycerol esterase/lipase EstA (alpha/beta hydrolase family)
MVKITSILMTVIMFLFPTLNIPAVEVDTAKMKTNYTYVFIHGLGGWAENTLYYDAFPYWGVLGGDMLKYLKAHGFECVAPSVTQNGSAWDRACEAYAQLTGTRVDYGKEHSKRCGHKRFGKDYTGRAMLKSWSSKDKINLMGHSFGGATAMELVELMMNGSEAERKATDKSDLSPLFTGGKGDWIYSVTGLAAPYNGTTAVACRDVINAKKIAPPKWSCIRDCIFLKNNIGIVWYFTGYADISFRYSVSGEGGSNMPIKFHAISIRWILCPLNTSALWT